MKSKVVGLTGQTGAGKSTVSAYILQTVEHCAVIDADKVAREIMNPPSDCLKRLAEIFGYDIIKSDGCLDRKLLAQRAFSSKEKTELLSKTTHPYIIQRTKEYIEAYRQQGATMILFDAPQLFESGGNRLCDWIVSVTAPTEVRMHRIMSRDGLGEAEALLRINAQHKETYYTQGADFVIDGSMSMDEVHQKVNEVMNRIQQNGDEK